MTTLIQPRKAAQPPAIQWQAYKTTARRIGHRSPLTLGYYLALPAVLLKLVFTVDIYSMMSFGIRRLYEQLRISKPKAGVKVLNKPKPNTLARMVDRSIKALKGKEDGYESSDDEAQLLLPIPRHSILVDVDSGSIAMDSTPSNPTVAYALGFDPKNDPVPPHAQFATRLHWIQRCPVQLGKIKRALDRRRLLPNKPLLVHAPYKKDITRWDQTVDMPSEYRVRKLYNQAANQGGKLRKLPPGHRKTSMTAVPGKWDGMGM